MTKKETAQIVFMLKEFYPNSIESSSLDNRVNAWFLVLKDYEYQEIQNAMVAFVSTDTKGFMPSVGQLVDKAVGMKQGESLTELQAWGMVSKALRNSAYGSEEEFAKLPPEVQRAVHHPAQLREWAMLPEDEVQTVISSNFQRTFRAVQKTERDTLALPESVKDFAKELAARMEMPQICGKTEYGSGTLGASELAVVRKMIGGNI